MGNRRVGLLQASNPPRIPERASTLDREGPAGRSNVKMSAAQFIHGGVITSFGDISTGPTQASSTPRWASG